VRSANSPEFHFSQARTLNIIILLRIRSLFAIWENYSHTRLSSASDFLRQICSNWCQTERTPWNWTHHFCQSFFNIILNNSNTFILIVIRKRINDVERVLVAVVFKRILDKINGHFLSKTEKKRKNKNQRKRSNQNQIKISNLNWNKKIEKIKRKKTKQEIYRRSVWISVVC
jgi:hypothetical protein